MAPEHHVFRNPMLTVSHQNTVEAVLMRSPKSDAHCHMKPSTARQLRNGSRDADAAVIRPRVSLLFISLTWGSAAPSSHQVEPGSERPRRDSQRSSESVSQQRGTLKAHAFLDFVTVLFSTPSIDSLTHSSVALLQRAYRSPPWYPSLSSAVILGNCHALGSNQDHQVQDQPTVGLELEMRVTTHSINVSSSSQSSTHVRSRYV